MILTSMDKIIFLHIPKTAGTTFRQQVLDRVYKNENCFHINRRNNPVEEFLKLDSQAKRNLLLITGHLQYGFHGYLDEDCRYITFLRDPIGRIISHYNFTKQNKLINKEIIQKNLTLKEYALSDLSPELDNGQTRQLSGLNVPINKIDQNVLNAAKINISKHIDIGITEQFDESLILLKEKYNWQGFLLYYKENVSRKKRSVVIDDDTIEAIKLRNRYDVELYNWCVQLFDEELDKVEILHRKLIIFKTVNWFYSYVWGFPMLSAKRIYKKIKHFSY